jgi:NAD(P)-dependent dehydrogenase (short-subunit alcohol dehydrogenase family)
MSERQPVANEPSQIRHTNPVSATISGIVDLFRTTNRIPPLPDELRIDGKTCLVTGANSGLGRAVAIQLAERGGHVIMACRSGIPEAGEEIRRESGSDAVEMQQVDLADLASVHDLCDRLKAGGRTIDIVVLNAGLIPLRSRRTEQGFELMFGVHFLANRLLVERLLGDGTVASEAAHGSRPRIIFVSSETHRSADPIDFDHFGDYVEYGFKDGIGQYGSSKLHMCTLAFELSRRLNEGGRHGPAVDALCPGPVASNIARESPALLKPVIDFVFRLFFRSPKQAAEPVVYLACSPDMEDRTGIYLHMMREKAASVEATDPSKGALLWEKSATLLKPYAR